MLFLAQIFVLAWLAWPDGLLLSSESSHPIIDPEQKREIARTGITTAAKIIVVLSLFFVMMAMRALNRRRLERSRDRGVKPWEKPDKK